MQSIAILNKGREAKTCPRSGLTATASYFHKIFVYAAGVEQCQLKQVNAQRPKLM